MKHTRRGRTLAAALLALALCLGLLSLTALAAGEDSWEHTDHTDWTELTADKLEALNYTLTEGKYYFKGDANYEYEQMSLGHSLKVTGNVTLCLSNVWYTYSGTENSAISIAEDASLIICCCMQDSNGSDMGSIGGGSAKFTVHNDGSLTVTGGTLSSNVEYGAAIYNAGTCTISGGSIMGSAGTWGDYKTAYGIYNADGAALTITDAPYISGKAPGDMNKPSGVHNFKCK